MRVLRELSLSNPSGESGFFDKTKYMAMFRDTLLDGYADIDREIKR
ncbi:hypothetical protein [Microbulbifer epialgicus]|uniref:Uncharacterized protein n=1 Tax=Microbulbifer epialgicus TaxID=393907 RepID=A0ABV4NV97_9GAMM